MARSMVPRYGEIVSPWPISGHLRYIKGGTEAPPGFRFLRRPTQRFREAFDGLGRQRNQITQDADLSCDQHRFR